MNQSKTLRGVLAFWRRTPILVVVLSVEGSGSVFMTANGMVGVAVPAGSSGTVAVAFREARRWMLADLVSAATVLVLAGGWVIDHRKRRNAPAGSISHA